MSHLEQHVTGRYVQAFKEFAHSLLYHMQIRLASFCKSAAAEFYFVTQNSASAKNSEREREINNFSRIKKRGRHLCTWLQQYMVWPADGVGVVHALLQDTSATTEMTKH